MTFHPLPPYFIVKVNKESQTNRREKIGSLYLHFKEVYMQRNLQYGEIVAIGSSAKAKFPQANVSDTLIFHHFVEGQENTQSNFLHADETDNYYFVTAYEFNGHRNETYAVDNGKGIVTHPEFVFIEHKEEPKEISADEFIEKNTQQVGSLILFNNWQETREEKEAKAHQLTTEIKNQSKGKSLSDSTKRALEVKQTEAGNITASLSKKEYKSFKVAAHNPCINLKDNIYSLSLAAQTEIDYRDKKFIAIQVKYCSATA